MRRAPPGGPSTPEELLTVPRSWPASSSAAPSTTCSAPDSSPRSPSATPAASPPTPSHLPAKTRASERRLATHRMHPLPQGTQGAAGHGARDRRVGLEGQRPGLHHADRWTSRPRQHHPSLPQLPRPGRTPPHPLPRPPTLDGDRAPGAGRGPRRHQGTPRPLPHRRHRRRPRPRPAPPPTPSHRLPYELVRDSGWACSCGEGHGRSDGVGASVVHGRLDGSSRVPGRGVGPPVGQPRWRGGVSSKEEV